MSGRVFTIHGHNPREIEKSTNAALGRVEDELLNVVRGQMVTVDLPATIGDLFMVKHSLGGTPTGFAWESEEPITIWATDADRRMWDATRIYLRGDVAEARIHVLVRR